MTGDHATVGCDAREDYQPVKETGRGARRTRAASADAALIDSAEAARRIGVSPSMLWTWRRERSPEGQRLRACIYRATKRSTWWYVAKLRAAGFIAAAPVVAPTDADRQIGGAL